MKKTILLSIALVAAGFLAATAQNNISRYQKYPDFEKFQSPTIKKTNSGQVWWEPDTVYALTILGEYRGNERMINKYNSHGLLKERIQQRWTNNSWVDIMNYTANYTYDVNNNILTRQGPNLTTYTYDANNNMLTECIQIWENDGLVNYTFDTYTYDANNNILTYFRKDWKNNSWVNKWLNTYTYDANNNMLTHLDQIWINNSWGSDYSYLHTYTYDANNNMLTQLRQSRFDNIWNDLWLNTYTYDSNNNIQTDLMQNGSGENHWLFRGKTK
jgi:hypothetical protein